jgi:hypothetical protein
MRRPAAPPGRALLLLELAGNVLRFTLDSIPSGSYDENECLRNVNYKLSITRSTNAKELAILTLETAVLTQLGEHVWEDLREDLDMAHDNSVVRQHRILTSMYDMCKF